MSGLAELQRGLQAYLLDGDRAVAASVTGTPRLDAVERLGIYEDAYRTRLTEALRADFPALATLLGDEAFRRMARGYIASRPSRHYSIRWFGGGLRDYLAADPAWAAHPVLAEMAAFEWALSIALDAADAPRLAPADMGAVAPEAWPGLCFRFHPSVQRLDLEWNVPRLWKAVKDEAPPMAPRGGERVAWLVWRKGISAYYTSLDGGEAWALDAALGGGRFAELCEGLCRWHEPEQVAARAAGLLHGWLEQGLISALRPEG